MPRKTYVEEDTNKPTHLLKMKSRHDDEGTSVVGAAWENSKGGFSIKLHRGVTLSWRDNEDCWITLWPNDYDQARTRKARR